MYFSDCKALTSIVIPESVSYIGFDVFLNSNNVTTYREASSQPERWASSWNSQNRPVVWGYTGD